MLILPLTLLSMLSTDGGMPHLQRVREKLGPRSAAWSAAHAGLLARCSIEPDVPRQRWDARQRNLPVVSRREPSTAHSNITSDFFGKEIRLVSGISVRAHVSVPDGALWVAADRIGRMLRMQPEAVRTRLRRRGAAVHVVGRQQQVSDLPELSHLRGRRGDYANEATDDPRRTVYHGVWARRRDEDPRRVHLPLLSPEQMTIDERTRGDHLATHVPNSQPHAPRHRPSTPQPHAHLFSLPYSERCLCAFWYCF